MNKSGSGGASASVALEGMINVVRPGFSGFSLKRQLTRRFGRVPAWAERRIDAAPVAQLDAWLDDIFDVASLENLIGDNSW